MDMHTQTIVIGRKAGALETTAADDLKSCLEGMTGRPARLVRDTEAFAEDGLVLVLGTPESNRVITEYARTGRFDPSKGSPGEQGLRVKTFTENGRRRVILHGRTPVGAMYAVYHFLERHCGVGFFPDGDRLPSGRSGGAGISIRQEIDETVSPRFEIRGYTVHPNWTRPYAHCCRLWGFDQWKRMIDWMRRKRFNTLTLSHDDGTYFWGDAIFRAFPEIKKDARTLEKFVMDPEYRTELIQRIFRYARKNGIAIAYNLMHPQVPDFFMLFHPELSYHELQMESVGICASQPECRQIMRRFWGKILETYGVDESHLYIVCPYQHEGEVCSHFPTSAPVAVQAWETLKEIDPQARLFVESWCWGRYWLKRDKPGEWRDFLRLTPEEIGVADLDRKITETPERRELFHWFAPRQWLSMEMLTLETCYPPSFLEINPKDLMNDVRAAADNGARGLIAFNIVANTNELLCDLSSMMGWDPSLPDQHYLIDFVRRRYGASLLDDMLESLRLQMAATDQTLRLVAGETCFPAETELCLKAKRKEPMPGTWIDERLAEYERKREQAVKSRNIALPHAEMNKGDHFIERCLWELDYTIARWDGIIEFYRSYRDRGDLKRSSAHFDKVLASFFKVKSLFEGRPEFSMARLTELAPDVKFLPHFLENWDTISRRWVDVRPYYYVVWEYFDRYEKMLRSMSPFV